MRLLVLLFGFLSLSALPVLAQDVSDPGDKTHSLVAEENTASRVCTTDCYRDSTPVALNDNTTVSVENRVSEALGLSRTNDNTSTTSKKAK